jgi:hypothetical protein
MKEIRKMLNRWKIIDLMQCQILWENTQMAILYLRHDLSFLRRRIHTGIILVAATCIYRNMSNINLVKGALKPETYATLLVRQYGNMCCRSLSVKGVP